MLDEYACRFYVLLEHAQTLQAEQEYGQMIIASYPHMKKEAQSTLRNSYLRVINKKENVTIDQDRRRLRGLLRQKR